MQGESVDATDVRENGMRRMKRPHKRRGLWWGAGAIVVVACMAGGVALAASGGSGGPGDLPAVAGNTPAPVLSNVSLTFDSGTAAQMAMAQTMNKYSLHGTFFINSGFVGKKGFMSRADLQELANEGQEIGGHTLTLADLPSVDVNEAKRQVCNDRVNLTNWGYTVTSFSYPFGSLNAEVEKIPAVCGYNSARGMATVSGKSGCVGCKPADTVLPADVFATKATAGIDGQWTLADLKEAVTASKSQGSWLQLVFGTGAEIDNQNPLAPDVFDAFCAWLSSASDQGITVRTVHEMIGKGAAAVTPGPVKSPVPPNVNAVQNPGLETPGAWNLPQCWQSSSYGNNKSVFSTVTPGLTGKSSAQLQVSGYVSGDAKVLPKLDFGECSPSVSPRHRYTLGATYTSTQATQIEVYLRDKSGTWAYWTASPWFPASADPVTHTWPTPPLPAGAVALSFGFNLFSNGTIVTDDYTMFDTTGK